MGLFPLRLTSQRVIWPRCLAAEGHFAEARVINQRLMPLHNKLFVEPNPIPVKWACKELGSCGD